MNDDLVVNLAQQLFLRYPYDEPAKLLMLAESWLKYIGSWAAKRNVALKEEGEPYNVDSLVKDTTRPLDVLIDDTLS